MGGLHFVPQCDSVNKKKTLINKKLSNLVVNLSYLDFFFLLQQKQNK